MEFWGVEVKSTFPFLVEPGLHMLIHISQIALGEKSVINNEPVQLFVKVGNQKLLVGTLSRDKIPHLSTEIILDKSCELSHNWKDGSVFFTGYKVDASEIEEDEDEPAPAENKESAVAKSGVKQVNFQLPNDGNKAKNDDDDDEEESEDESDDDSSSEDSEPEEEKKVTAEVGSDEEDEDDSSDEEDEDDSSDDETPEKKKAEESKKRSAEANTSKGFTSNKKAKFVTPQKSETKKPHVHIATPHPSKQGGKNSGSNGEASQQTPKSGGAVGCKSCNRTFGSEMGLQSHTKAKHNAPA